MSAAELLDLGQGRFGLSGPLDFSTVEALLPQGLAAFAGYRGVELDLQGVTRVNSAGLALLLEWLDHGRGTGFELRIVNPPESLQAIARMSNVDVLLAFPAGGD